MYLPSPNLGLTPCGTYNPNARDSDAQGRASLNMWSAQCQGLRRRQHRTEHNGHMPKPRIGIKIPDPAGNRTQAAGLEGRDSTDHATATNVVNFCIFFHLKYVDPKTFMFNS